jgi:hypothetical protein
MMNLFINDHNYFEAVDAVMLRLEPLKTEEERTIIARQRFFDAVLQNIDAMDAVKQEFIGLIKELAKEHTISIVSTNTKSVTKEILVKTGLQDVISNIEFSIEKEKDDKEAVLARFIEKHGKPDFFIGSANSSTTRSLCEKQGITFIGAGSVGQIKLAIK